MALLQLVAGWVIVIFLAALGIILILKMLKGADGGIDLSHLVSEDNGNASLSRFQFLIFTFVIGTGLLLIILESGTFPTVGSDVYGLLGISAASYVGSKIAQKTGKPEEKKPQPAPTAATPPAAPQP